MKNADGELTGRTPVEGKVVPQALQETAAIAAAKEASKKKGKRAKADE